ncbi:nucleotidyltransferase domain-containing protein [Radiobacillus deserti]|uniref:Nucleotidyltransferase domain-containing protein n=1 Tax=Radiobacillus deserti TaxID=2594883 RepID=A0A516KDC1_9BACI|nr:nucleotidyltransferase domain-containing protein [Radiobacillus deserti]QDP39405.1 nucleotidyltransferase domain-containing protein [Radiobacillus deserti]
MNRLSPIEAAQQFIEKHFPNCQGAFLGGSTARGEYSKTSDLDIVVIDNSFNKSYRESLIEFSWPIEVFVHNRTSYQAFFESDKKRARPSLPRMIAEGIVLKDDGEMEAIRKEAAELLELGPEPWSKDVIDMKRYFITDALDDFIGSTNRAEDLFIANALTEQASEFVLRTNGKWIGASKWVVRSLKEYDGVLAQQFVSSFDLFYRNGDKSKVINLVDEILAPFGGRLFEGFSIGKS